ncbi:hypothetical protein CTAYLR_004255 [Chrysophaeum taylorii]|uniref:Uncharacterized protein n=1 Tax=Chrysophaeum taylorii TaxID=2483200 RepID=A0AAD7UD80_9STRA|nr:hypothetical protein CTAYLR_004255 [Chrysophaeum taylorii]
MAASAAKPAIAHVGPIRRLTWSDGDKHLITIGQTDRLVCVWRYEAQVGGVEENGGESSSSLTDEALEADSGRTLRVAVEKATKAKDDHLAKARHGQAPRVRIWDALTGATIAVMPRHLRDGIEMLAFSPDGMHLAAIGGDQDHCLAVYATKTGEWGDAMLNVRGIGGRERVFCVAFIGKAAYPVFVGSQDGVEFACLRLHGVLRRQSSASHAAL